MSERVLEKLRAEFGDAIQETHSSHGDDTAVVAPASWKAVAQFLRDDPAMRFDMLADLTAVDFPDRTPRLEVVVHLMSIERRHRVRIKTRIGDSELESVSVASLTDLWKTADWLEREVFDMFGVHFEGHPDLRRILMYPEFEGYPLRKDYPASRAQPLIEYRTEEEAGVPLDKLAPFREDEGMSFSRRDWTHRGNEAS